MARVLVVGGAGYVGSATCAWLVDQGHEVWVLDDLTTGRRSLVLGSGFFLARVGDRQSVRRVLRKQSFDCVMHFAARSLVGESVEKPEEYHENNVLQTQALLETMLEEGVRKFVFSSTCAVFGDPGNQNISESLLKNPINPYGKTKLEAEKLMARLAQEKGLQAVVLRYFNAAGAEPQNRVGELHMPETHLIPRVLQSVASDEELEVFGNDYPTPDGTCVRDYVHVSDLAQAHESAMLRLIALSAGTPGRFEDYNLGSENGFSVLQVIQACEKVTGKKAKIRFAARRPGDPPRLVAVSTKAKKELNFQTTRSALEEIVRSAWNWHKRNAIPVKAVFLDRDGTLNDDPGYLNHADQMRLLPSVPESLLALKKAGYLLVVVSNQSGVGRGLIEPAELPRIHQRMEELLAGHRVSIDHYELCFHKPEDCCECRKPKAKLLSEAARKLNIDLKQSYMVGDKASDLGAGRAAGCKGVALVRTGSGQETEKSLKPSQTDFVGNSLQDVARWILSQGTAGS